MTEITEKELPFAVFGHDLFGDAVLPKKKGPLAERFEFPPFSVLNARDGEWQNRKRAWVGLGIKSELGRGEGATYDSRQITEPGLNYYRNKARTEGTGGSGNINKAYKLKDNTSSSAKAMQYAGGLENATAGSGTSVFDPVPCELMYRWFCPPGGQIVDPFAGGSVRGIVAGLLGFKYHGIDLRPEQIRANEEQKQRVAPQTDIVWRVGDSATIVSTAPEADFIFSCPPYGDLEVYSDLPEDLSSMNYGEFIEAYRRIIKGCVLNLKNDRMACFVVGDFRDKKTGYYRGFVSDTIVAFKDAGMGLYNDAVLITCVGSLPIRVSGQFEGGRKLGKSHQNILVFAKGEPKKAFI